MTLTRLKPGTSTELLIDLLQYLGLFLPLGKVLEQSFQAPDLHSRSKILASGSSSLLSLVSHKRALPRRIAHSFHPILS